jgi:tape measure domain-containing protein
VANNRVGGLYIAVGVDTRKALTDIRKLRSELAKVAGALDKVQLGGLDRLDRKLKDVGGTAAKTQKQIADAGKKASTGLTGLPDDRARLLLQQEKQYFSLLNAERAKDNQAQMAAIASQAKARQVALQQKSVAEQRSAAQAAQLSQREARAAEQAREREARAAEKAAQREIQASERAAKKKEADARRAAAQQEKLLQRQSTITSTLTAGSQQFLVGAGAARSGNYFYGLAATVRLGQNLTSEFGRLPSVFGKVAVAGVAIGSAVAAAGAAGTIAAAKLAQFAVGTAARFQMLQIQLEGLLGSQAKAQSEFDFLIDLGKESIVPTESLIAADRQLLAFGVTADKTRRELVTFFSDFGTATGASEQQVYYLSLALGQVAALGKANTIDLRQLANAGINLGELYAIIGEKVGKSAREVAEGVSEGIVTSELLFESLTQFGTRFTETAEKAKKSTVGLLSNIKDIFVSELGIAFLGVNSAVSQVLDQVQTFLEKIDFKRVAYSASAAFSTIKRSLAGVDFEGILEWLNKYVPEAINAVGYYVANLIKQFRTLVGVVNIVGQTAYFMAQQFIIGFAAILQKAIYVLDAVGIISDDEGERLRRYWKQVEDEAVAAGDGAVEGIKKSAEDIYKIWSTPVYKPLGVIYGPYEERKLSIRERGLGPTLPPEPPPGPDPISPGGGRGESPAEKAAKKLLERYKKLIDEAKKASEGLAEAFVTPFARVIAANGGVVKSAAQKAFESGDIQGIITQYQTLAQQIRELFAPFEDKQMAGSRKVANAAKRERKRLIAELRGEVELLVVLAAQNEAIQRRLQQLEEEYDKTTAAIDKRRTAIETAYNKQKLAFERQYDGYFEATSMTEGRFVRGSLETAQKTLEVAQSAYEKAQAKLDSLLQARQQFLDNLASSLRGYVNTLSGVKEEIEKYTRLDEFGSFTLTKESGDAQSLANFRQGLRERLDALKEWTRNVRAVVASGLNSDLVQQLVQAGPEASGALVKGLAGASAADIAEINAVQQELAAEITSFQATASAQWFDAGVAAQEAFTAPLKKAYESAQNQVAFLDEQRRMALGVLEAWYADQQALFEAEQTRADDNYATEKEKLDKALKDNVGAAEEAAKRIQGSLSWLSDPKNKKNTYAAGVDAMQGFWDGLDAGEGKVLRKARSIAERVAATIRAALKIASPSKVMIGIGENVTEGLAVGMENSISSVEDAARKLSSAASDVHSSARSAGGLSPQAPPAPLVKVFIGDQELKDLVDVQISYASDADRDLVIAGRRF